MKFHFQGCQRGLSNHSGEEFSFFPFVFLYFLQAKGFHRSSHWSEVARGRKSQFWLHYPVSLPLQLNTKRNATHTPERIRAKGLLQKGRFEAGASNLNIKRCRAGGAELEPLLPWLRERPQKKSIYFPLTPRLLFHCLVENLNVFPTLTKAPGWAALPGSQWLCWCWRPCTNGLVGLNFLLWDEHEHFVAEELSSAAFHLPPNPPGRDNNLGAEDPKPIVLTDGT